MPYGVVKSYITKINRPISTKLGKQNYFDIRMLPCEIEIRQQPRLLPIYQKFKFHMNLSLLKNIDIIKYQIKYVKIGR